MGLYTGNPRYRLGAGRADCQLMNGYLSLSAGLSTGRVDYRRMRVIVNPVGHFVPQQVEPASATPVEGVSMDGFIGMLDEYMGWYRDKRIKTEFGMSIMDRRRELGLVA